MAPGGRRAAHSLHGRLPVVNHTWVTIGMPGFGLRVSASAATEQRKARAMNVRSVSFRAIDAIFVIAMVVTFSGLGAGVVGILNARLVSLIALIGAAICALAAFAFLALGSREFRRSH